VLASAEYVVNTGEVLRGYPHALLTAIIRESRQARFLFLVTYWVLGGVLLASRMKLEYRAVLAATILFGLAHVLIFPTFQPRFYGPITVIVSMSLVAWRINPKSYSQV
jgi:hypothetical protein